MRHGGFPRESKSVMEGVKESVTATQLSCRRQDGDLGKRRPTASEDGSADGDVS